MSTSVIVLSRQPGDWLAGCLASVAGQADEVILVDNGSPGGTAAQIGRAAGAVVLSSSANLGFAGGVNLGLRTVKGDVVGLLNDDATAAAGWLASAMAVLDDASVAAVTPKVLRAGWFREVTLDDPPQPATGDSRPLGRMLRSVTAGGEDVLDRLAGAGVHALEHRPGCPGDRWRWTAPGRPWYIPIARPDAGEDVRIDDEPPPPGPVCRLLNKAGGYLRSDGVLGDYGDETPDDGRWDRPGERFFASGTAMVARAETFRQVGELADPFFAYYEDADWSWRARLAGLRLVYDPGAVVEHRHSATSGGSGTAWVRGLAERNRLLCMVRNAPAIVAATALRRRLVRRSGDTTRAALLAKLPWAVTSRRRLAQRWQLSPEQVWGRWAGVDLAWDDSPARRPPPPEGQGIQSAPVIRDGPRR